MNDQNEIEGFHWDEDTKTWCLAGETLDRILWETDDFEAENIEDAIKQARDYLDTTREEDEINKHEDEIADFWGSMITSTEIERAFSLSPGTVRQYMSRHADEMIERRVARKADGRTWLIYRSEAERIWGRRKV